EAMRDEVPMLERADRVAPVVELRDDSLEVDALGADAHVELVVTVRTRRDEQPLDEARPPVAIDAAEEQFAVAPLRAHIRFGGAARDHAVFLAEIIGIPLQPPA